MEPDNTSNSNQDQNQNQNQNQKNTQLKLLIAFIVILGVIFVSNPAIVAETKMAAENHSGWTASKRINHSEAYIHDVLEKLKNYGLDLSAMILDLEAQQILASQKVKNFSSQIAQLDKTQNRLSLEFNDLNVLTKQKYKAKKTNILNQLELADTNNLHPLAIKKLRENLKAVEQETTSVELAKLKNSIKKVAGKKSNLSKKLELHKSSSYQGSKKLDKALSIELDINDKISEVDLMRMQAKLEGTSSNPLKNETLDEINVMLAHIQALGSSYDDLSVMGDDYFSDPTQDEEFDALIEEAVYSKTAGL